MVHITSALFVVALVVVHLTDREALHRPLSTFRDGPSGWVGYVLFGLLLGMAGGQMSLLIRARQLGGLIVPVVSFGLLAFVSLTPSFDGVHGAASVALLALVFAYYAVRLYLVSSPWLFAHLAAPVVIGLAVVPVLSYGVIQKALILYFVFAVNADCLLVAGRLTLPWAGNTERPKEGKRFSYRPRVIYRRYDDPKRPTDRAR